MSDPKKITGQGINRIDGLLKVTGTANYATDYPIKNIAHAVLFKSTIASGKIRDTLTIPVELLTCTSAKFALKL